MAASRDSSARSGSKGSGAAAKKGAAADKPAGATAKKGTAADKPAAAGADKPGPKGPKGPQQQREAERRAEKLKEIKQQVKDGSLVIRQMTAKERKEHGPPREAPPRKGRGRRS